MRSDVHPSPAFWASVPRIFLRAVPRLHTCSQSCPSQTARSSPSIPPYLWRTLQRTMPGN
ncbi:6-phosphogluconolactonase (predicted), isoform CRA_b [Rattus norvegicus]|uniref:6-phosphogluconolactonase (Predicted), isoform CRA_b n=1 Tax=Rattus norvegicus TaxID=10116 RepID=A6K9W7_RAT|nr:6-phosphogluconolactonase (predicted), isoform CRA_b [Rattus norvegicus]